MQTPWAARCLRPMRRPLRLLVPRRCAGRPVLRARPGARRNRCWRGNLRRRAFDASTGYQQCCFYRTDAATPGFGMMDSLLRLRGCAQPCAAPNRQECPFNASRGHRRDPSRRGHRRDPSRRGHRRDESHRRDSGIRPGCHPTPGPRTRLGTIAGTARVGPGLR
jgi:hypothetical protein